VQKGRILPLQQVLIGSTGAALGWAGHGRSPYSRGQAHADTAVTGAGGCVRDTE
jgi:hypothetical protein